MHFEEIISVDGSMRGDIPLAAAIHHDLQRTIRPRAARLAPVSRLAVEEIAGYLAQILAGGNEVGNLQQIVAMAAHTLAARGKPLAGGSSPEAIAELTGVPRKILERPNAGLLPIGSLDPRPFVTDGAPMTATEIQARQDEFHRAGDRALNETEALRIWKPGEGMPLRQAAASAPGDL